jgi:photosystem II stability/assembly factor-like uncharacterized protein
MANWENVGPIDMDGHGGRVISHAFDPLVPNVVWAGSASGGLWLSEDAGNNWMPMTNDIPSTGVGAVVVHPNDSDIVLIGTGEGYSPPGIVIKGGIGVFKSTDRGQTWLPTDFDFPASNGVSALKLAWHPANFNEIWLAATNGLWKSNDMGDTWTMILGDGTNHQNFIFDDIIIQQNNPNIIFVSHEGVGILKSTDGGNSFNLLTNGLPTTDINFISIDQCTSQPNTLYASFAKVSDFSLRGLYKSIDNGTSWTALSLPEDPFCLTVGTLSYCQGWYDNTVAVSPDDPDLVLFGGITFWRSDDGGISWEQKDRRICPGCVDTPVCATYVDHHDIGFDPHNTGFVYNFSDGGVSRSEDNGDCWSNANNGLVTAQLFSVASGRSNSDVMIGGLQDHGLQGANIANGLQWERWGFFDGANVQVDHSNANRFFGSWIDGTYWRSLNGTNTIATQITNGINLNENTTTHFAPLRMHPTDPSILLGSTQQGVYRTENLGNSWVKTLSASIVTDLAFSPADPNVCYAASWTGTNWFFYRSDNTGQNWEVTASAPGWRVTDVVASGLDPQTVYASRNSINPGVGHIYKSTNGGDSWVSIQGDLIDITVNAIAVDPLDDQTLYAATDLGVFITVNGGQNWTEFNEGLPITYVNDIQFNGLDRTLLVATLGRGVWISDAYDGNLSVDDLESSLIGDFVVYPNPTAGNFKVAFTYNNTNDRVVISILNYLGQRLGVVFEGTPAVNKNTFELSFDDILLDKSNGVYFVRVETSGKSFTRKLILSR